MRFFLFAILLFPTFSQAGEPSTCEDIATERAVKYMNTSFGEVFVKSLWGPMVLANSPKPRLHTVIVGFHTGTHDPIDIVSYVVSVNFTGVCEFDSVSLEIVDPRNPRCERGEHC